MTAWKKLIFQNRLYVGMLLFVLLVNSLSGRLPGEQRPPSPADSLTRIQQNLEQKLRSQEEVVKLLEEKRHLTAALIILGTAGILALFLGIVFIFALVLARTAGKEIVDFGFPVPPAAWSVGDVIRVVVLFLFFSHCIFLVEAAVFSAVSVPESSLRLARIFNGVLFDFVGLALILYFVLVKYRQRLISLGLTFNHWIKNTSLGLAGYIFILPLLMLLRWISLLIARGFHYQPQLNPAVEIFWEEKSLWFLLGLTLFVCVVGPLIEELFFRGFVYSAIKKEWGRTRAILLSSVFFASLHLNPVDFLPILLLGVLLAWIYEKTGSLFSALTVHVLNNSVAFLFLFLLKALFG